MAKQQEESLQKDMPETGDTLDQRQQGQLDDFLENITGTEETPGSKGEGQDEEDEDAKTHDKGKSEKKGSETSGTEEEGGEEEGEEGDEETKVEGEEEGEEEEEEEEKKEEKDESELISLRAELAENKRVSAALERKLHPPKKEEPIKVELDGKTLISEEEAQEFLTDPRKVLSKLAERIYIKAREDTLKDIPQLVESGARRQTALTEARTKFWIDNADLREVSEKTPAVSRLIRITATDLQAEHSDWTIEQIFEETGKQVRVAISLAKKAQKIEESVTKGKRKGNQAPKPRGRRKSPPKGKGGEKRSGLQTELNSMLDSME